MQASHSAQNGVLGYCKSDFIRLSKDNSSLQLRRSLMSVKAPLEFWNAAEAGKANCIKISLWQRQVRNEHAGSVDSESSAEFVGDVRVVVGGESGSEGARMLSMLRSTSGSRVKVEQMSPLLLSSTEIMQRTGEISLLMKDELTSQVADLRVRIASCNRSAAELEDLLTQHMMESLHQRRLAQKLLDIVDFARHPPLLAPHCSTQDLETITDSLKVTARRRCTLLVQADMRVPRDSAMHFRRARRQLSALC